ncbi:putative prophage MuSo2 protein [uncultured Pleomorphomonas sp.]|uniref:Putative prophage MuSo2 protein n=1 Tax=uncultured Pleomorphomonas sp. TaxID=442121 RepID=A0A212LCY8_9HYPH|nr:phage protease [uncultured Pleomorphomonas sp.]SCM75433.1 putative prophage MuSo2 protein [uncultured Pleomorphomonas sp.]
MTNRPHFSQLASAVELALGLVTASVTLAADAISPPAMIQIAPRGRVEARDGRSFEFRPEDLVARFAADGVDIPVDLDHASAGGGNPHTVGWVKRLEARADGLWAAVEWLEEGVAVLKARTRRYISPAIRHTDDGTAVWIHSVALVAAPALAMGAVASTQPGLDQEPSMKSIAAYLGLSESASETAILAAVTDLKAKSVSKADHDAAVAKLGADLVTANGKVADLETKLSAIKSADHTAKVNTLLEAALKDKKILPAEREHYAKLAATPEGLLSVTAIIGGASAKLGASGLDGSNPPESHAQGAADLAAKITAYVNEQAKLGITVTAVDALAAIERKG